MFCSASERIQIYGRSCLVGMRLEENRRERMRPLLFFRSFMMVLKVGKCGKTWWEFWIPRWE